MTFEVRKSIPEIDRSCAPPLHGARESPTPGPAERVIRPVQPGRKQHPGFRQPIIVSVAPLPRQKLFSGGG
ncbi:hypothetical protein N7539_006121 [Penicillium diatomitis]|uniref:Uncharacterized protein n=1 Tax=Penicillium diatomitis TaxID=2819901 RepID=A0A9W9X2Z0_9EURO|nr:uncharacterized protein N7539_006121 [Penicillium diatomitis]KAJ5482675.1 hypothetical protein N7539_006121 [Penicillium diatomitis]